MLIPRTHALDRLLRPFYFDGRSAPQYDSEQESAWQPRVDVEEMDDKFVVRADLPGMDEKNIEVTLDDGVLSITARREDTREEARHSGRLRERRFGRFARRFQVGPEVDAQAVGASYKSGVLAVELPKKAAVQARQIEIRAE
ncbi:MAG: Hsp20 family protein [Nannocystaceae bacterium]